MTRHHDHELTAEELADCGLLSELFEEDMNDHQASSTSPASDASSEAISQTQPMVKVGDYVLATKYSDGDPGDPWALGWYTGEEGGRHYVKDNAGKNIRGNGYRRVARIRKDVGRWLLEVAAKQLEASPPGTVNLWTMLTPLAFATEEDRG